MYKKKLRSTASMRSEARKKYVLKNLPNVFST